MSPVPTEVRDLGNQDQQVRSGPVRFGKDWPGVFIRGDNIMGYVDSLNAGFIPSSLIDLLQSCLVADKD